MSVRLDVCTLQQLFTSPGVSKSIFKVGNSKFN